MKATLYKPGQEPIELSAEQITALVIASVKRPVNRLELDADRQQVAQVLGSKWSDTVFADWDNVIFGATGENVEGYNEAARIAANELIHSLGMRMSFGSFQGPVLIVQNAAPPVTGWACTKPGQVKHHYYTEDGKSLCRYQRQPGPLHTWSPAYTYSRKVPESACSSCELAYSRLPKAQQK